METEYNPEASGVLDKDLSFSLFGNNSKVKQISRLVPYSDLMQYEKKRYIKGEFKV